MRKLSPVNISSGNFPSYFTVPRLVATGCIGVHTGFPVLERFGVFIVVAVLLEAVEGSV